MQSLTFLKLFEALESDLKFVRREKGSGVIKNLDPEKGDNRHCERWDICNPFLSLIYERACEQQIKS